MTAFRFAVCTAVSSSDQAGEERDSLDRQLINARAFGEKNGGAFTREYRAVQSRADYYDLSQAFVDIPEFGLLARDARAGRFDVVIVDSFDRLGDLAFAFLNFFKPLKIQLRSVQQPVPIDDPATYDPRRDDASVVMVSSSMSVQTYRINKIVRAFAVGNPRRARDGKYATQVPYGYLKVDKNTVEVDELPASLIRQFPLWYLSGKPMSEIVKLANESGVPSRNGGLWSANIIMATMRNPFYAGKTFYGRYAPDKSGNYRPRKDFETYPGNHEALWTWETHCQLQDEIHRRHRVRQLPQDYNFTGIIKCSECGDALRISYNLKAPKYKYWHCPNKHVSIRAADVERMVADELVRLFADAEYHAPTPKETEDRTRREILAVDRQIARLDQAYRFGSHTPEEYARERQQLHKKREDLQNRDLQQQEAKRLARERQQVALTMRDLLPNIHWWIANHKPPREVKYHLGRVVSLTAFPDKTIQADLLPIS